jgi:hypothetical protein
MTSHGAIEPFFRRQRAMSFHPVAVISVIAMDDHQYQEPSVLIVIALILLPLRFFNLYLGPLAFMLLPSNLPLAAACFLGRADPQQAGCVGIAEGELILDCPVV